MYTINVTTRFEASHALRMPDGRREPVHTHEWCVRACFGSAQLDKYGLVIDFHRVEATLDEIIAPLRGKALEDWEALKGENASAERVAEAIHRALSRTPDLASMLRSVTVTEAPGCEATYWCDEPRFGALEKAGLTIKP